MSEQDNQRGEPSMEEILSSIKRIIADDQPVNGKQRDAQKSTAASDAEILELTESQELEDNVASPATSEGAEEQLLGEDKIANLANRFSTLQTLSEPGAAPQIVRSGETSLEELTRELLRPMLKEWLDTKLPEIVEAMVAREIQRITKKN